ncbi:MAG TPA: NADPH-dependent FMN reductase [Candidatus Binataceae bacterium]|nr:NADPH-dependent FMN reductase [Candidatus Binataceae bacterium]
MAKLVGVLGSVTPPGRLLSALKWTLESENSAAGSVFETDLINLADCRIAFADGRPPDKYDDDTGSVVARVSQADAVILASPVYRGSYTGALKNLLDHLPIEALAGKPIGIVAMGATNHHYLGVDWHLRDVLAWFGAIVVPTSVYLSSADFVEGNLTDGAKQDLTALVQALYKLKQISPASGEYLGPRPLASRRG